MTAAAAPLRVLMLLNRVPYPLNDGGAIGAFGFVKGYAGAGCTITMLAMNTARHLVEDEKIREVLGAFGRVIPVYIDNRIKPVDAFVNLLSRSSYIIQRFISPLYRKKLEELLVQSRFDVIHVDGLPPSVYMDTIRKHSKAIVAMRAHNVEHIIWKRSAQEAKNLLEKAYLTIQYKRLKMFEIKSLESCDVVLAISREDEAVIKECAPSAKTIVVPAGMEISTEVSPTSHIDLFFIGSFDWLPNLQGMEWFFENVWQKLNRNFPALQFFIAGKKMPEAVKRFKSGNVIIADEVPDAKEFILQHGIMVVPLVSGSGIRIKIVEAMALGKTIIATTIAAEGLGLTDGENILMANNADEYVRQIGKCLNDPAFCRKVGQNAHRFAYENFQNKKIFEKLTSYYRN